MKAEVQSLRALFETEEGFAAPFHQRPYRWSRERNWEPFWDHWLAIADGGNVKGRRNFLGALVCRRELEPSLRDSPDNALRTLEMLDGQQRILTAMMAFQALRLHGARLVLDAWAESMKARLFDSEQRPRFVAGRASYADQMAALRTERLRPTPLPTLRALTAEGEEAPDAADDSLSASASLEAFERRVAAGIFGATDGEGAELDPQEARDAAHEWDWEEGAAAGSHRLRTALRYFYSVLNERLSEAEEPEPELKRLASALLDDTVVVLITVEGGVSPFDVFERLNNLGEPLSALDLLKNQLFKAAEAGGMSRSALEAFYRAHWRIFDDTCNIGFWAAMERRGRDSSTAQDWFLRAYLSVRESRNVSMAEARRRVHELADNPALDASAEIRALCDGARAFAEINGHSDLGPHRLRIEALRRFARFAVEPMLIAMRMHLWSDEEATRRVLEMLESVAVRRFFAEAGGGKDYDIYARIAREIGPGAAEDGRACVRAVARRLKGAQGGAFWPKDSAFKRDFAIRKLANRNSNQQARDRKAVFRTVFAALDGIARGAALNAEPPWEQSVRTVEHLFPLHGREQWPALGKADAQWLETIGNLTLVLDDLNKDMGEAPWAEKRRYLEQDRAVRLNADLLDEPAWREGWGPEEIRERGRRLAELAVRRWPRPR